MLQGWRERFFSARGGAVGNSATAALLAGPRPRLENPSEEVERANRTAATDVKAAIARLERLAAEFAPDPHVLHALCLLYHRAGQPARALELARKALPVLFKKGQGALAAELFDVLNGDAGAIGLGRDELMALGGALGRTSYWSVGFRALATVTLRQPGDPEAYRELLRVAEYLVQGGLAVEAAKVLQFLVVVTEDPERLAEARRRLAALAASEAKRPRGVGAWDEFLGSLRDM